MKNYVWNECPEARRCLCKMLFYARLGSGRGAFCISCFPRSAFTLCFTPLQFVYTAVCLYHRGRNILELSRLSGSAARKKGKKEQGDIRDDVVHGSYIRRTSHRDTGPLYLLRIFSAARCLAPNQPLFRLPLSKQFHSRAKCLANSGLQGGLINLALTRSLKAASLNLEPSKISKVSRNDVLFILIFFLVTKRIVELPI